MRLVDTSAWIEWLIDGPMRPLLASLMPAKAECVVPTLVQHELAKWLLRERGEEAADEMMAYTQRCVVVPLDTRIALLAASTCRECRLATADGIIYATALATGSELLTCDAHFEGLAGVRLLRKGSA